jgi:hypothetical protein
MEIYESDLDGFASQLVDKCMATRRERVQMYQGLYHYYLFGAQDGQQSPYGKIYPHIDLLTSYLYSQATVEFDVAVDNVADVVYEQAERIGKRTNTYFHSHGVAGAYKQALSLALVWNSSFLKINPSKPKNSPFRLSPYIVEPHNFGVLNESVPELRRQEAFVHAYYVGKDELRRRVSVLPNGADIMRRVSASPVSQENAFPESIHRIIVAGPSNMTTSTTRGIVNIPELFNQLQYKPQSVEDQVEMYELWAWDDQKEDWRTITLAAPGVVVYGRKDIGNLLGVQGEQPFIHVCANRLHNYFYGWSEIVGLVRLQDWASERLREIRAILTKQADPPKSFSGFGGINDEKAAAFGYPGSTISDPTPNAKVEFLAPDLPNDLWQEIIMIQNMFNDVSGLSDVLQGKGEAGVRSKAQTDTLAKLGSARIKSRAQTVEGNLEEIGALIVNLMKAKDDHRYLLNDKVTPFTAAQFTKDFQVHVDAHSASPVFVDDHVQLALALKKLGVIDSLSTLELTKPPKLDLLKQRLKQVELARAQQMEKMLAAGVMPKKGGGLKAA